MSFDRARAVNNAEASSSMFFKFKTFKIKEINSDVEEQNIQEFKCVCVFCLFFVVVFF